MSGLMTAVRLILAGIIGAGMAYFWSTFRPADTLEVLVGVGIVGALASFVVLYFMGKGQG